MSDASANLTRAGPCAIAPPPGILVVDDNTVTRKLFRLALEAEGYQVVEAPHAAAALACVAQGIPALALLDLRLPDMGGAELAQRLRALPGGAELALVAVSGFPGLAGDARSPLGDFDAVVMKPIEPHQLVELVRGLAPTGDAAGEERSSDYRKVVGAVRAWVGGAAAPLPAEPADAHRRRIVQRLERQAIVNACMVHRCAVQAAQLAILGGMADALASHRDVEHAMDETLAACLDAGGISRGALFRVRADGQLVLRNAIGFADVDRRDIEAAFGYAHLIERVMASGIAVSVLATAGAQHEVDALLPRLGVAAAVIAPLLARDERLGALLLGTSSSDLSDADFLGFGRTIAATLGQALALAAAFERETCARREAERASRAKDEFLSTLSHELRTPLAVILGWAYLLGTRASDRAWLDRAVATIERNAKAQVLLIDDLLDVARINSGRIRLDPRAIHAAPPIQAVLDTIAPTAEAKGVVVDADLDPGACTLWGDPGRVQQIVWNLVANAVKFTPRGGRVRVRLARRDGRVQIQVSDSGEGIRADFLPHLFERFRQADSSATRAHGGLGLGLWIARHLVGLHGGEIHAESDGEGRGATFTVSLPLHVACPAPEADPSTMAPRAAPDPGLARSHAASPGARPGPPLAGLWVLVVEDEADTGEMLATVLRDAGAAATAVGSAAEALVTLERTAPDVLVSDICMPVMDGYALMRAVRRSAADERRRLPALALTACASPEDCRAALSAGFQAHLGKPIDPGVLVSAVAELVGRAVGGS